MENKEIESIKISKENRRILTKLKYEYFSCKSIDEVITKLLSILNTIESAGDSKQTSFFIHHTNSPSTTDNKEK